MKTKEQHASETNALNTKMQVSISEKQNEIDDKAKQVNKLQQDIDELNKNIQLQSAKFNSDVKSLQDQSKAQMDISQ